MIKGRLISFEGIDGTGKTTQAKALFETLKHVGVRTIMMREPSIDLIGRSIRDMVCHIDMPQDSQLLLITANRKYNVERYILPALEKGIWVVADRFIHSSWVYQDTYKAMILQEEYLDGLYPDLTFVLDLPVKLAKKRINKRKDEKTIFDKASDKEMQRRRDTFVEITTLEDVVCINAEPDERHVQNEIWRQLNMFHYLQEYFDVHSDNKKFTDIHNNILFN